MTYQSNKMKHTLTFIAAAVLTTLGQQAYAAERACAQGWTWTGGEQDCELFKGDDGHSMLEIGVSIDENDALDGYAYAENILVRDGGQLSIIGKASQITINNGGTLYVSKDPQYAWDDYIPVAPATVNTITVNNGGLARVYEGGSLYDATVNNGGKLYVYMQDKNNNAPGQTFDAVINDGAKLFLYEGGLGWDSTINAGGNEYVQTGARSTGSQVNTGGEQTISGKSFAIGASIAAGATQNISTGSTAEGNIVYGNQYVGSAHADGTLSIAKNTQMRGASTQILWNNGVATDTQLFDTAYSQVRAGSITTNLTINDDAYARISADAKALGVTTLNGQGQLQLVASSGSTGAYVESVNLVGANSSIAVLAGSNIGDSVKIDRIQGQGQIKFHDLTAGTTPLYSTLNIDHLSGGQHFILRSSIQEGHGDYIKIKQGSGQHQLTVTDTGVEITHPAQSTLDLVEDKSSGAGFVLADLTGANVNAVDGGTYMYSLYSRDDANTGKVWYLATSAPEAVDPSKPPVIQPPPFITPPLITTPSTDAVLSMGVAPALMMKNEMQNLRFRRGELKDSSQTWTTWGKASSYKDEVDSKQLQFDLKQSGLEMGIDHQIQTSQGRVFVGISGSYNTADVDHQRGGTSKSDSIGVGLHATYFDDRGFYLDGNLKFNRFDNELRARSTNGTAVNVDYKQNGVALAVEAGYNIELTPTVWTEPYVKLAYAQAGGKNIQLNNGMVADIKNQNSTTTEVGAYLGKDFTLESNGVVTPYVKAAWVHEFTNDNESIINHNNRFSTSLSGDQIKLGAGVNARISERLNLHGEVNIGQGNKLDSPFQVNIGVNYSF